MTTTSDAHGPIDFVLLEFPNDRTDGSAAEALLDLVEAGTIRLLDLVVARKEDDGTVEVIDIDGAGDVTAFVQFSGARSGLLGDDDIQEAGAVLTPGTTAALIVFENAGRRRSSPRPARTAARSSPACASLRRTSSTPSTRSTPKKRGNPMPGLLRGVARTAVVAGTASAVSGRVQRRQADKFAERDAHAAAQRSEAYAAETGQAPTYAPPTTQYGAAPQQVYAAPPQQQYAPAPAAPAAPSQADVLNQLKQLGELRDAGVLTEEEFAGQKAKLLG